MSWVRIPCNGSLCRARGLALIRTCCSGSGKRLICECCALGLLHLLPGANLARDALCDELNIPKDDIKGWTVIYRKELSKHLPLDISWCNNQQHPEFCEKSVQGLYWDRLNRYFDCKRRHPKLATRNAPILEEAYQKRQETCSSH